MPGVCFYFEDSDTDVWSGHDLDAWGYACKVAGDISDIIVVNKTTQEIPSFDRAFNLTEVADLAAAEALMTGEKMYLICPWEAGNHVSIAGNLHTADWYVFGPATGFGGSRDGVFIPQAGQGAVHSVHAATVVMFHRYWTLN